MATGTLTNVQATRDRSKIFALKDTGECNSKKTNYLGLLKSAIVIGRVGFIKLSSGIYS